MISRESVIPFGNDGAIQQVVNPLKLILAEHFGRTNAALIKRGCHYGGMGDAAGERGPVSEVDLNLSPVVSILVKADRLDGLTGQFGALHAILVHILRPR
jgi:hypothetical protein